MNWLAHVFLSEASIDFQLGNLLADLVRGDARHSMSPDFVRGAECHKESDRFTDAHPVVRRSRSRIEPPLRRFSGVLVDVFYDHLLARAWSSHASIPLQQLTSAFNDAAAATALPLPRDAHVTLQRIIRHEVLASYEEINGVHDSLARLSRGLQARWGREFALEQGATVLAAQLDDFDADFAEFFPALLEHIDARWPVAYRKR